MTLTLNGTADVCRLGTSEHRAVIRLRELNSKIAQEEDFTIVRTPADLSHALEAKIGRVVQISDNDMPSGNPDTLLKFLRLPAKFSYLSDGDILGVQSQSKQFRALYRRSSPHNSFLVTDRCNHYCLMCSQPPKHVDDRWILDEIRRALPLVDPKTKSLGFTGGETLTDWKEFIPLMAVCRDELPHTAVHVLSNGRVFAHDEVIAAWSGVKHPNLTVGIPIYSCVDHVHDYVVQAHGAFDETVLGILKLKNNAQRVEIRVVLHSITAPRVLETCKWIARNMPFVDHVALMGLENTGFAIANADLLWIDPVDYRQLLKDSVEVLDAARVKVSIYNLQRCVIDRSVWKYAAQSISDWKNNYHEKCNPCIEKDRCAGFFSSGRPQLSRGIAPIGSI